MPVYDEAQKDFEGQEILPDFQSTETMTYPAEVKAVSMRLFSRSSLESVVLTRSTISNLELI